MITAMMHSGADNNREGSRPTAGAGGYEEEEEEEWFYLDDAAEQKGPFTVEQLARHMADGKLQRSTWVWSPATDGWKELADNSELLDTLTLIISGGGGGGATAHAANGTAVTPRDGAEAPADADGLPRMVRNITPRLTVESLTTAVLMRRKDEDEGSDGDAGRGRAMEAGPPAANTAWA